MGEANMKLPLFGIGEACIIHSVHDYVFAMFFKEFMKWIGISFFDFTYHADDTELNEKIKDNHFDFIFYINDKNNNLKNEYADLTDVYVDICTDKYDESIWTTVDSNNNSLVLNKSILTDAFDQVIQKIFNGNEETRKIFDSLAEIYCSENVLHKMLDNKYALSFAYGETRTIKQFLSDLAKQYRKWNFIISELEKKKEEIAEIEIGFENYVYALVYSKRKSAEISSILRWKTPYQVKDLLNELDSIYFYRPQFYMGESLKAKIASMDPNRQIMSVFYMKNCTDVCPTDACDSFHYYRMGKFYELLDRNDDAWLIYQKSYKKNPLNFRALFKLAVNKLNTEKYNEAEGYLKLILRILQICDDDCELIVDNLKYLPVLEMEYVCKCFLLLESLEYRQNGNKDIAKIYYKNADRVHEIVESSWYLKEIYKKNYDSILECVRARLTEHVIQRKLRNISGLDS